MLAFEVAELVEHSVDFGGLRAGGWEVGGEVSQWIDFLRCAGKKRERDAGKEGQGLGRRTCSSILRFHSRRMSFEPWFSEDIRSYSALRRSMSSLKRVGGGGAAMVDAGMWGGCGGGVQQEQGRRTAATDSGNRCSRRKRRRTGKGTDKTARQGKKQNKKLTCTHK